MSDAEELVKRLRDGDFSNLNEAADLIECQTEEIATLRKDAKRYRWLRSEKGVAAYYPAHGVELDAAIDDAMKMEVGK